MSKLAEGTLIAGKYRLLHQIGRGGMGSVWAAHHLQLDTNVALKFIDPGADAGDGRIRFEWEAQAAAKLRSPHIIQILDHGVDDDQPYIVMELLEGEDLGERLRREGRISAKAASVILTQAAKALRRAHDAGVIHRDLKPSNIFLARFDDDEVVKLLDFGVAKIRNPSIDLGGSEFTQTGVIFGSPAYMSPEQARGVKGLDHRSDLWSLAVIMFRAVTGEKPFEAASIGDLVIKLCIDPLPIASKIAPDLSPEIDAFFLRTFARELGQRFSSAMAMAAEFEAIANRTAAPGAPAAATPMAMPAAAPAAMPMAPPMAMPAAMPIAQGPVAQGAIPHAPILGAIPHALIQGAIAQSAAAPVAMAQGAAQPSAFSSSSALPRVPMPPPSAPQPSAFSSSSALPRVPMPPPSAPQIQAPVADPESWPAQDEVTPPRGARAPMGSSSGQMMAAPHAPEHQTLPLPPQLPSVTPQPASRTPAPALRSVTPSAQAPVDRNRLILFGGIGAGAFALILGIIALAVRGSSGDATDAHAASTGAAAAPSAARAAPTDPTAAAAPPSAAPPAPSAAAPATSATAETSAAPPASAAPIETAEPATETSAPPAAPSARPKAPGGKQGKGHVPNFGY